MQAHRQAAARTLASRRARSPEEPAAITQGDPKPLPLKRPHSPEEPTAITQGDPETRPSKRPRSPEEPAAITQGDPETRPAARPSRVFPATPYDPRIAANLVHAGLHQDQAPQEPAPVQSEQDQVKRPREVLHDLNGGSGVCADGPIAARGRQGLQEIDMFGESDRALSQRELNQRAKKVPAAGPVPRGRVGAPEMPEVYYPGNIGQLEVSIPIPQWLRSHKEEQKGRAQAERQRASKVIGLEGNLLAEREKRRKMYGIQDHVWWTDTVV
ncbi:hypothetical protein scyTo_0024114 [Scyliorhinus torazame]|uniref:Uncharacterized protein n=1 Tax=Scyliorhinus torazame TaxID=75743 RepID=A0A401QEJ9_SCYTO|nr:hypothetical protein [Scyliorhinus torazame]